MTANWPVNISETLVAQLDDVFAAAGLNCEKRLRDNDPPSVDYDIDTKPDLDLRLTFSLTPDTLFVHFNDCYLASEYAAHVPKFRTNPNALADWQAACVDLARSIARSDLKVVKRSRGRKILGGYLYFRVGDEWVCCGGGGSLLMSLGIKREDEYTDWQRW